MRKMVIETGKLLLAPLSDLKFYRNGLEDGIPVDEFGFASFQEDVSDDLSPLKRL